VPVSGRSPERVIVAEFPQSLVIGAGFRWRGNMGPLFA